ncbi:MAG: 50S ribosomal protein L10 [Akkermansia sp.]|nr:50S ribosomal protein L10 [Akkermansia sp.]MDO4818591.1 50S ribosomal protein L10 [Akkermansia sp.]
MSTEHKMNADKAVIIEALQAKVNASPFLIVIDYTGITVPEFTDLRAKLAASGASCMVAKNSYMGKALAEAGLPDISAALKGQTAYVMGESDVCAAAKVLNTFAKATKKAPYKVGIMDGAELEPAKIQALGDLPSREVLLATLLGTINGAGSALARVIQAYVDKEGGSQETAE